MTDVQELIRELVRQYGPHCYRAFVAGQGYTNDGSNPETREDYDRQYRRAAESQIENMRYAPGYAEPGHTQPANGVLLADWNVLPSEVADALETAGYAIEWEDEWIECDDCRRTYRSQPDSHFWRMFGQVFEHDRECLSLCVDCLQEFAQQLRDGEIEDEAAAAADLAADRADAIEREFFRNELITAQTFAQSIDRLCAAGKATAEDVRQSEDRIDLAIRNAIAADVDIDDLLTRKDRS